MKQSLVKTFNSSHIFHPPPQSPPGLHSHYYPTPKPTPKPTPSLPRQACKISRRDVTIRGPFSSLLILLGGCCDVAFDPFSARADEIPSDVGDGRREENWNADIEAQHDRSQTNISNGGGEEENAISNSGKQEVGLNEAQLGQGAADSSGNSGKVENSSADGCGETTPSQRAFLDISIDGEPAGRIVIGLYKAKAPAGTARFSGLVSGAAGISYRRKEFVKIVPNYIQHGGVRSYGVDAELASRTGSGPAVDSLVAEWEKVSEKCPGTKNVAGAVGIIVRDPSKPPPKLKLVARRGKLEIDREEVGNDPNGTEFVISTKDSPELDSSTLVIGRVIEGMDVVGKISKVKSVQENTGSPYFRYFPFL